jgi:hypothetical protein
MIVMCDGDRPLAQKAKSPSVETDDGIVKQLKGQEQKARDAIRRSAAGESNETSASWEHSAKQHSPIERTELGI